VIERVIDADGHVLEPMSAWDGLAESAAIHVRTDKYGLDHVFAGNQEIVTAPLGLLGTPGSDMSAFAKAKPFADAQPGGFDPVIRLGDMDAEGINVAVLYPSVGLNFWAVKDPEAAVALARAYNDSLAGYCAADPRRFLESGGGWAPDWTYRLDEQVHGFGGFCPAMKLKPSEYFARQCWISFEIDEPTLPALIPFIGEERVVWGSDYPHHDATFPGAVDELREVIAPLPPSVQAKVLGGNAAACYRLPSE
jgi:predicted TIM-barrel fold metal-dependent hydrolase